MVQLSKAFDSTVIDRALLHRITIRCRWAARFIHRESDYPALIGGIILTTLVLLISHCQVTWNDIDT